MTLLNLKRQENCGVSAYSLGSPKNHIVKVDLKIAISYSIIQECTKFRECRRLVVSVGPVGPASSVDPLGSMVR